MMESLLWLAFGIFNVIVYVLFIFMTTSERSKFEREMESFWGKGQNEPLWAALLISGPLGTLFGIFIGLLFIIFKIYEGIKWLTLHENNPITPFAKNLYNSILDYRFGEKE